MVWFSVYKDPLIVGQDRLQVDLTMYTQVFQESLVQFK